METAWDKVHYNPQFGPATNWDFSLYRPQLVIVAIGQNGNHPEDYMKEEPNQRIPEAEEMSDELCAYIESLNIQW